MNIIKINKLYTYTIERRLTMWLFLGLIGMIFLYILLVAFTTYTISLHRALQSTILVITSNIGDVESEYADLSNTINREHALLLGFTQPKKEIFAFRKRLVRNEF